MISYSIILMISLAVTKEDQLIDKLGPKKTSSNRSYVFLSCSCHLKISVPYRNYVRLGSQHWSINLVALFPLPLSGCTYAPGGRHPS